MSTNTPDILETSVELDNILLNEFVRLVAKAHANDAVRAKAALYEIAVQSTHKALMRRQKVKEPTFQKVHATCLRLEAHMAMFDFHRGLADWKEYRKELVRSASEVVVAHSLMRDEQELEESVVAAMTDLARVAKGYA